tara:strand:+ start:53935 stop:55935 length:2001 start_codon:yes stop_codon:yes gene_type:complete
VNPLSSQPGSPPRQLVVFRRLSAFNLIHAVTLRHLGRRVVVIQPIGALRTPSWLARLDKLGIELADFHSYAGLSLSEDLRTAARYTAAVLDTAFTDRDFDVLQDAIPCAPLTPDRARALMFNLIFNRLLPYSEAFALAEYFRSEGIRADIFQSRSGIDALLDPLLPTQIRNLFPAISSWLTGAVDGSKAFSRLANRILHVMTRVIRSSTSSSTGKPAPEDQKDGTTTTGKIGRDILYFPHKGITYGELFVKDQYYSDDPDSPFHQSNVGHVELAWTMSPGERKVVRAEYDRQGVQPHFLDQDGRRNAAAWLNHVARIHEKLSGPHRLAKATFLAIAAMRFENFRDAMAPCRGAHMAIIGYDALFPATAALVLQSFGIHVAALQERFIIPLYGVTPLILNSYFVHGALIADAVDQDRFQAIDTTVVTGDPRRGRIDRYRAEAESERHDRFAGFRTVCLVLDFQTKPDSLADPFHFWTDAPSNLLFYSHIADLAESNPDCAFVVRGKNAAWLKMAEMAPAKQRFELLDNVFIDDRYDVFDRSYLLAAMADVVVARYTSLCDQCLAAGIPVLIHEPLPNGGRLISAWHDYKPFPVLTFSFQELQERFDDATLTTRYMETEQFAEMRRTYYGAEDGQQSVPPENALRRALENIYARQHHDNERPLDHMAP